MADVWAHVGAERGGHHAPQHHAEGVRVPEGAACRSQAHAGPHGRGARPPDLRHHDHAGGSMGII